jgi:hypothetical protein
MMPIDRQRMMPRVLAIAEARQIIRDRLKAENKQPSRYASREISVMAEAYLAEGHWAELEAEALAKIMASPEPRAEYEAEGRKYEAKIAKRRAGRGLPISEVSK